MNQPEARLILQPFISYAVGRGLSVTLNSESTYDWKAEQWTLPIDLMIAQVLKMGKQPIQLQVGGRYYAEAPEGGPEWAYAPRSRCSSRKGTAESQLPTHRDHDPNPSPSKWAL